MQISEQNLAASQHLALAIQRILHFDDHFSASKYFLWCVDYLPIWLSYLARACGELGRFDEAWSHIGEAITAVETTKETWYEAEVHPCARLTARMVIAVPGGGAGTSAGVLEIGNCCAEAFLASIRKAALAPSKGMKDRRSI
jgi:hypothetical protein